MVQSSRVIHHKRVWTVKVLDSYPPIIHMYVSVYIYNIWSGLERAMSTKHECVITKKNN